MLVSRNNKKSALAFRSPPSRPVEGGQDETALPTESVTLSDAKPAKPRRWGRKLGLGFMAALSLTGTVGAASYAAAQLPSCQQEASLIVDLQQGEVCRNRGPIDQSAMVGYSGDSDLNYDQVASNLLNVMDEAGVGDGYNVAELQRVAADPELSEDSRLAAQEVLADPILMKSMDVAADHEVNMNITAEDLAQFAQDEPDAGAFTFLDLASQLSQKVDGTNAFTYFDSRGGVDDSFSHQDLQSVARDKSAPEEFREVANEFLDYPNLFNGFDVAQSEFRPEWWDDFSGVQKLDGVISHDDLKEIRYSPTPEEGEQWTDADRAALARIAEGGELSPDLFTAFKQTNRGNCVATAVIKASMDHYGGNVLREFTPNKAGGYDVVMHDGFELSLTGQEMEAGATASHYVGEHEDTMAYADLLFTSAAKRAQLEGHERAGSFGQALLSLNNGERSRNFPRLLGLQDFVQPLDLSEVGGQDGVVIYGGGHSYYVDTVEGQTLGDRWGQPTGFAARTHVNEGKPSRGAYTFNG